MTKSEKVPILGIFSPKTILMFRVGLKNLGRKATGTTHTFHLSLTTFSTEKEQSFIVNEFLETRK